MPGVVFWCCRCRSGCDDCLAEVKRTFLYHVWTDDIAGAAMTVDVINAALSVVFFHEDRQPVGTHRPTDYPMEAA